MRRADDSATRTTLLGRLRLDPTDPAAWAEFVEHYGRKIYGWCRKWNLQEADAQDVTQEVLLKLAATMRSFSYDRSKSFRSWLKTLTQHAWSDFLASRQRTGQGSGDSQVMQLLQTAAAGPDLIAQLEAEFDQELLEEAKRRVRLRVEARTWEAFRLLALEGLSGAEVARRLGMKVATVYMARSKVQKRLQEEIQRLEVGA
jgi:RNA polymerase sigma-70 factor (ECF subfamily)